MTWFEWITVIILSLFSSMIGAIIMTSWINTALVDTIVQIIINEGKLYGGY